MKKVLHLLIFLLVAGASLSAQKAKFDLNPNGIEVYNHYNKPTGFFVFSPESVPPGDTLGLVVFLHGYGGLNPLNYGAWLRQLIEAGNVVIYPRYQRSILLTSPKKFAKNAVKGIRGGLNQLADLEIPVATSTLTYVGHSYGGTLAAFMMAKEDSLGFPKAFGALLAAPGTNRFKGSRLQDYSSISPEAQLVIVTHEGDYTTGTEFAELVHQSAKFTSKRIWIRQAEQVNDTLSIGQGHNECYALDKSFDSGYRNYTTKKALRVGCIDVIDRNLYWPLSLELAEAAQENVTIDILRKEIPEYEFGMWPNGKPLKSLTVEYGKKAGLPTEREVDGN